jgi:hypothetical protein
MSQTTSAPRFRTSSSRAVLGFALFALWLGFLAVYATGDLSCFDPATGRSGIDAFGHCASHHPLGLNVNISEDWPLWSFAIVPPLLAVIWWPYRPWRTRA